MQITQLEVYNTNFVLQKIYQFCRALKIIFFCNNIIEQKYIENNIFFYIFKWITTQNLR